MTLFFKSRTALRQFPSKNGKRVDNGPDAGSKRWAFQLETNKR